MSGVFYGNPRFQQQRPQPNSTTVQRLLDENASLIQTIIEYQKRGSVTEVYEYEQVLHRNLVYLGQLADPGFNTQALPPPPPPSAGMNGPLSVNGGATPVRMPNITLGQMQSGPNPPRPQQPPSSVYASVDGTVRPQQVVQPSSVGMPPQAQQPSQQMPQTQPSLMSYRPPQALPNQPPPQAYGAPPQAPQYGGQPPQSAYGQPPQMVQMVRQPGQMQPNPQMGMAPQNPGTMMRQPGQMQYGQAPAGMYQQNPMQSNGPMSIQSMPPMGGMPPGGPQPMQQMPPGYQPNYQPNQ